MRRLSLVLVFFSLVGLGGCGETDAGPSTYTKALDRAENGWQELKADYGDDYRYVVVASSVFGPSYETTLTVQDDRVVQRALVIAEIDGAGNTTVVESWSETGGALGSHDEGAELLTVDGRYAACRTRLEATDPTQNTVDLGYIAPISAEPAREFVLATCLILPKNVAYDGGAEHVVNLEFLPARAN